MKQPQTRKQLLRLDPARQLRALATVCKQDAGRCRANTFLGSTWVEDTFESLAEDLKRIAKQVGK